MNKFCIGYAWQLFYLLYLFLPTCNKVILVSRRRLLNEQVGFIYLVASFKMAIEVASPLSTLIAK